MKKKVLMTCLFMICVLLLSVVLIGCVEQLGQALKMRIKSFKGCKPYTESSCVEGVLSVTMHKNDCTTERKPDVPCTYGCSDDGKSCRIEWRSAPSPPPSPPPATPVCGNRVIETGEECDSNVCANGLACTASCTCPEEPPAPTAVNCVTQYGAGFKCISRTTLTSEELSCTKSGGHLESHCAAGDSVCTQTTVATSLPTGKAITSPSSTPGIGSSVGATPTPALSETPTQSISVTETGPLPLPERCCVKCVSGGTGPAAEISGGPLTTGTISGGTGPATGISGGTLTTGPLGHAVLNTNLVDCGSFVSGAFCVATETEFQDRCKGSGMMYPAVSCLTESDAGGFCVVC